MSGYNLNKTGKYITHNLFLLYQCKYCYFLVILDSETSCLTSSKVCLPLKCFLVSVTFYLQTLVGPLEGHESPPWKTSVCVQTRGWLTGLGSCLPACEVWGQNSGCKASTCCTPVVALKCLQGRLLIVQCSHLSEKSVNAAFIRALQYQGVVSPKIIIHHQMFLD